MSLYTPLFSRPAALNGPLTTRPCGSHDAISPRWTVWCYLVAPYGTYFYTCGVSTSEPERSHQISQRDLRNRSAEIMDGLERGERYAVTRNGHHIGDLVPIRRRRRAVSRAEFAAMSRGMPRLDDRKYREDMDRHVNDDLHDPYDRAYGRGELGEGEQ